MVKSIYYLVILIYLISYSYANKRLDQSKAIACLTVARIYHQNFQNMDPNKQQEIGIGLVNCFTSLNTKQLETILRDLQSQNQISLSQKELKELMNFKNALKKYNQNEIMEISKKIQELIQEVQSQGGIMSDEGENEEPNPNRGFNNVQNKRNGGLNILSQLIFGVTFGIISSIFSGGYVNIFFVLISVFLFIRVSKNLYYYGSNDNTNISNHDDTHKND